MQFRQAKQSCQTAHCSESLCNCSPVTHTTLGGTHLEPLLSAWQTVHLTPPIHLPPTPPPNPPPPPLRPVRIMPISFYYVLFALFYDTELVSYCPAYCFMSQISHLFSSRNALIVCTTAATILVVYRLPGQR